MTNIFRITIVTLILLFTAHFLFAAINLDTKDNGYSLRAIDYRNPKLSPTPPDSQNTDDPEKEFNKAKKEFDESLDESRRTMEELYREFARENPDKTIREKTNVIAKNPKDAEAYIVRSIAYCLKGQTNLAKADEQKATELGQKIYKSCSSSSNQRSVQNKTTATVHFDKGSAHLQKKEYNFAIQEFSKAVNLGENDALIYLRRGTAYLKTNQFQSAVQDFTKAIELNQTPYSDYAYESRAEAYEKLGQTSKAVADRKKYQEFLDKIGNTVTTPEFYGLLEEGKNYNRAKQYDLSIQQFNKAIASYKKEKKDDKSKLSEIYRERGKSYNGKKLFSLAIQDFNKAIELNPGIFINYNERGLSYYDQKNYDFAIRDFTKSIELNPKWTFSYFYRGSSYFDKKEYDSAIRDFTKTIELDPKFANGYYLRGVSHHTKNLPTLAIQDYSKAIELNPRDIQAYRLRAIVYDAIGQNEKAEADRRKYRELGGQ